MPTTVGENSKGKPIEAYKVYSIEIKHKKERYYVHITYDVDEVDSELTWSDKINSDYIAGIDVILIEWLFLFYRNKEIKKHHSWKLWNVVHKTIRMKNQEIQLKEV